MHDEELHKIHPNPPSLIHTEYSTRVVLLVLRTPYGVVAFVVPWQEHAWSVCSLYQEQLHILFSVVIPCY
jgi:hypothetical protein